MSRVTSFSVLNTSLLLLIFAALVFGSSNATTVAEDADAPKRMTIRDERPDDSRGWMVVSKKSYWPLCYEALDQINETKKLIGTENHEELADSLDKCGAWLDLAASAAMTDSATIEGPAWQFQNAADEIRAGKYKQQEGKLNDIITLGLVSIAKSHVLRADVDKTFQLEGTKNRKKQPKAIADVEKEIEREKTARQLAQYAFDTRESKRHLEVAQVYLKSAASAGGFKLDSAIVAEIPEPEKDVRLTDYVDEEIRTRIKLMNAFITTKRKALIDKLNSDD